jgi:hypothetical protein
VSNDTAAITNILHCNWTATRYVPLNMGSQAQLPTYTPADVIEGECAG